MKIIWNIVATAMLLNISQCWGAEQQANDSSNKPETETSGPECEPRSDVLRDGTFVVRNRDCTTKWISKDDGVKPQASSSDLSDAGREDATRKLKEMMPQYPPSLDDPVMKAKYLEAMNGYYDYHTAGYIHRGRVFQWQLLSSKIIFII